MFKKSCNFSLNLEIKTVTCPGVWLCTNGNISLTLSAFGIEHETKYVKPIFPLNFHQVFYFKKNLDGANNLTNLKRILRNEAIYFMLIQWPSNYNKDEGKVLSKFHSSLDKIIYPNSCSTNDNIELLMEPSSIFPGILSPKIEIFTMIKIVDDMELATKTPANLQKHIKNVNLNFTRKLSKQQNAVCHSNNYHKKYYDKQKNLQKSFENINVLCRNISQKKYFDSDTNMHSIKNRVSKIYQLGNCGVCNEYNRLFENISLPLPHFESKNDSVPTYKIFNAALSNGSNEDIPNSLQNRIEKILSDESDCNCKVLECSCRRNSTNFIFKIRTPHKTRIPEIKDGSNQIDGESNITQDKTENNLPDESIGKKIVTVGNVDENILPDKSNNENNSFDEYYTDKSFFSDKSIDKNIPSDESISSSNCSVPGSPNRNLTNFVFKKRTSLKKYLPETTEYQYQVQTNILQSRTVQNLIGEPYCSCTAVECPFGQPHNKILPQRTKYQNISVGPICSCTAVNCPYGQPHMKRIPQMEEYENPVQSNYFQNDIFSDESNCNCTIVGCPRQPHMKRIPEMEEYENPVQSNYFQNDILSDESICNCTIVGCPRQPHMKRITRIEEYENPVESNYFMNDILSDESICNCTIVGCPRQPHKKPLRDRYDQESSASRKNYDHMNFYGF